MLGAWNLSVSGNGYATGDPAYLSFGIGAGYSSNDLEAWYYDGSHWASYNASNLTYDGSYTSFTVSGFGNYAITTPEPGTLVLLGISVISLMAYNWKRWRHRV